MGRQGLSFLKPLLLSRVPFLAPVLLTVLYCPLEPKALPPASSSLPPTHPDCWPPCSRQLCLGSPLPGPAPGPTSCSDTEQHPSLPEGSVAFTTRPSRAARLRFLHPCPSAPRRRSEFFWAVLRSRPPLRPQAGCTAPLRPGPALPPVLLPQSPLSSSPFFMQRSCPGRLV